MRQLKKRHFLVISELDYRFSVKKSTIEINFWLTRQAISKTSSKSFSCVEKEYMPFKIANCASMVFRGLFLTSTVLEKEADVSF